MDNFGYIQNQKWVKTQSELLAQLVDGKPLVAILGGCGKEEIFSG